MYFMKPSTRMEVCKTLIRSWHCSIINCNLTFKHSSCGHENCLGREGRNMKISKRDFKKQLFSGVNTVCNWMKSRQDGPLIYYLLVIRAAFMLSTNRQVWEARESRDLLQLCSTQNVKDLSETIFSCFSFRNLPGSKISPPWRCFEG